MDPIRGKKINQDSLFAYQTKVHVLVKDRTLGIIYYLMTALITGYIFFFVLLYDKGYNVYEQAKGATATHVKGDVLSLSSGKPGSRFFSAEELSYPSLENGNVFVATRQRVFHQVRGTCEDLSMPCTDNSQCSASVGGTCSQNGFCVEPSWCLVEGDEMPEIYELEVGDVDIWVKSSIEFSKLRKGKVFSTEKDHPFPQRGFNLFSVRDLLMRCEPTPVRYEEISELGAVIEVQIRWNCNVARDNCVPDVKARRLDVIFDPEHIGYSFSYSEPITEDERMLNEMKGVRIFFRTTGIAHEASFDSVMLKLMTSVTLLIVPQIVVDTLMLFFFARKAKYKARKYDVSPDFSDYMKKVEEKHEAEQSNSAKTDKENKEVQDEEQKWQERVEEMGED